MHEFSLGQTPLANSEAMSDVEAQEVLRLHLKQAEGAPQLSVQEVADAIHLPENEVRKLLADVREQKRAEDLVRSSPGTQEKKRRDIRIAVIAGSAFLFAMLVYFVIVLRAFVFPHNETRIVTRNGPSSWVAPEAGSASSLTPSPIVATTKKSGITATFEGQTFVIPGKIDPAQMGSNKDLLQVLETEVRNRIGARDLPTGPAQDQEVLNSFRQGIYDAPLVDHPVLTLQANGTDIFVHASMIQYTTSNSELQDIIDHETHSRIQELLQMISTKARLEEGVSQTH